MVVTSCKTTPLPAPDAKDTCFSRSEKQIDHHMFSDRFLSTYNPRDSETHTAWWGGREGALSQQIVEASMKTYSMRDLENGERGRGYIMFDGKRGGGSKTRFMVILFRKISLISFSFLVPCLHCFSGFGVG